MFALNSILVLAPAPRRSGIFVRTKLVLDIECSLRLPELPAGAAGWVQRHAGRRGQRNIFIFAAVSLLLANGGDFGLLCMNKIPFPEMRAASGCLFLRKYLAN